MRNTTTTLASYKTAEKAAFKEAAKHSSWSSANVYILLGDDVGPISEEEKCIRVDVINHDERAPDQVVETHDFRWKRE